MGARRGRYALGSVLMGFNPVLKGGSFAARRKLACTWCGGGTESLGSAVCGLSCCWWAGSGPPSSLTYSLGLVTLKHWGIAEEHGFYGDQTWVQILLLPLLWFWTNYLLCELQILHLWMIIMHNLWTGRINWDHVCRRVLAWYLVRSRWLTNILSRPYLCFFLVCFNYFYCGKIPLTQNSPFEPF